MYFLLIKTASSAKDACLLDLPFSSDFVTWVCWQENYDICSSIRKFHTQYVTNA